MRPSGLLPSSHRLLAALLAALTFVVASLVFAPGAHQALHEVEYAAAQDAGAHPEHPADAAQHAHVCAITLFAQGLDAPAVYVPVPLPEQVPAATPRLLNSAAPCVAPAYRLPPSQAPPRLTAVS